ncbi:C1 family peptidase [Trichocoleus sp. FACHB-591]|uniref:C1 family peptidase n=1 Tax=Trichocoleus sp. FACHB-591 TaxID=2692872 RepID=UPI0016831A3D|nr:C1 family peptidase [Trichocoleus sp. FACHB-591]MBD2094756.1 C1 family peptidase [Trichocoleus sp. FACHB-591]
MFKQILHPQGSRVVVGGYHRDRQDDRDRRYARPRNVKQNSLPKFVDLRRHMTAVENQGELGSCTANAIAGAYEYLAKRLTGQNYDISRLFIYYLARKFDGCEQEDSGATLRRGMKVLTKYGACSEAAWPYDIETFCDEPHDDAFQEAAEHLIDEYDRIDVDLHAMKVCLSEGYPFVFGSDIFQSFEDLDHRGHVNMPLPSEENLGGHAMLACGYSDKDQVFLVRNSWGTDWGDKGYCYIPYEYLTNADLTGDCWTLRRANNLDFSEDISTSYEEGFSFFDVLIELLTGTEVPTDEEEYEDEESEELEEYDEDEESEEELEEEEEEYEDEDEGAEEEELEEDEESEEDEDFEDEELEEEELEEYEDEESEEEELDEEYDEDEESEEDEEEYEDEDEELEESEEDEEYEDEESEDEELEDEEYDEDEESEEDEELEESEEDEEYGEGEYEDEE